MVWDPEMMKTLAFKRLLEKQRAHTSFAVFKPDPKKSRDGLDEAVGLFNPQEAPLTAYHRPSENGGDDEGDQEAESVDMIPNVKWSKNLNRQTTSHAGAAADLLIMAHSALAVVFRHSSFWISVAAHRCPSPGYGKNASYSRWKVDDTHGEALVPWSFSSSLPPSAGEGAIGDPSSVRGPKPDFNALLGGSPWKSKSEPGGKGQDRWHSGFFGYTLGQNSNVPEEKPRFSRLHYLGCDQSFGTRCFHDQMLMSPTDGQPIVGDTYGNEFGH